MKKEMWDHFIPGILYVVTRWQYDRNLRSRHWNHASEYACGLHGFGRHIPMGELVMCTGIDKYSVRFLHGDKNLSLKSGVGKKFVAYYTSMLVLATYESIKESRFLGWEELDQKS